MSLKTPRFAALAALSLALFPTIGAAAAPCLTSDEFAAVAQFALPGAIEGARVRCAATLPGDAFLNREAKAYAARIAADGGRGWPAAKAAFLKLADTGSHDADTLLSAMPDEAMQQALAGMVGGLVTAQLPLERCATVDRVLMLLSPLPPRNTAELVATLVVLRGEKKGGKLGPLSICPAAP